MLKQDHTIDRYPIFNKRPIPLLHIRKLDGLILNRKLSSAFTLSPIGCVGASLMTDCQPPYTADSNFSLMAD